MINWNRFDRIYVQCFTEYASTRQAPLAAELARVGISGAELHWGCPNPFEQYMCQQLKYYKPDNPGGFQCLFGHYQILKTAYALGYERILVLEDDVRFLTDRAKLDGIVLSLPHDYDVAKFEWSPAGGSVREIAYRRQPGTDWVDGTDVDTYGAAATAYSRRGMRAVIESVEALVTAGEQLRNIDDLGSKAPFFGFKRYLCAPVAAIQSAAFPSLFPGPRAYWDFLAHGSRAAYGDGETAGCNLAVLHDKEQMDEFVNLLHVAYRGKPIRMLEIGSYRGESAKAFVSSGLVPKIYCVDPWKPGWDDTDGLSSHDLYAAEIDFDKVAAKDPRIVKVKGTVDDFVRDHADAFSGENRIDLVYIDASYLYKDAKHIIEVVRDIIHPTLGIAGRVFTYDRGVRPAVLDTLGFPYQVFSDTSWFCPADKGVVPPGKTRYWHFLGGRLGNQLYYPLQAYRMGPGNVYAGAGTDMQTAFTRLGCGHLVVDCDKQEYPYVQATGQHWNLNLHYTLDELHAFVRDVIQKSELYRDSVEKYGLNESAVAVHVRNTDFITDAAWGQLDRDKYVPDALAELKHLTGTAGKLPEVHLFSDDNAETERRFGKVLRETFEKVVYMDLGAPEEDLVHLALYRTKILFNSTFSTWAAHIGDVAFGGKTTVIAPSVFYAVGEHVEPMSTLANPDWHQITVRLKDGRLYEPHPWPDPQAYR